MRAKIWRGAKEVGGSCIELEAHGSRVVLDVGMPLNAGRADDVPLPAIAGLADGGDPSLAGVVVSHPHLDHYGLLGQVHPSVPVIAGTDGARVVDAASFFSPITTTLRATKALRHRTPIEVGQFQLMPYLNDHSAYDAYSLLVEAAGRRLFYTGDIRGHGRKARLFDELLADPPADVDVLLMEGTHVRAVDETEPPRSERDLELSLAERMRATAGAVAVVASAQNIDRLVTVYRACRRAGRILVLDLYTATVAAAARLTIPQPGFPGLQVWLPQRQRLLVKHSGEFHRTAQIRGCRMFPEQMAARAGEITVLTPSSGVRDLLRAGVLGGGNVIWSMWPGYLRDSAWLTDQLGAADIPLAVDHVSGHAPARDLRRLVDALRPRRIVPIHTEHPDGYSRLFPRVEPHPDGEWWDV